MRKNVGSKRHWPILRGLPRGVEKHHRNMCYHRRPLPGFPNGNQMTLPAKPILYISSFCMRCLYSLSFAFSFLCHSSFFLSLSLVLSSACTEWSVGQVIKTIKTAGVRVWEEVKARGRLSYQLSVSPRRAQEADVKTRGVWPLPKQVSFNCVQ